MPFRRKLKKKSSKRMFAKGANRIHKKNGKTAPMRGGIRL